MTETQDETLELAEIGIAHKIQNNMFCVKLLIPDKFVPSGKDAVFKFLSDQIQEIFGNQVVPENATDVLEIDYAKLKVDAVKIDPEHLIAEFDILIPII